MPSRILAAALLASVGVLGLCQSLNPTKYSETALRAYDSFFFRAKWLQDQADLKAAQGKDDSFLRSAMQRQTGLSDQDQAFLNNLAADWRTKDLAVTEASQSLIRAGARGATSAPLQDLARQRKQNIADHIDQLRATLGEQRFRLLDLGVQRAPSSPPAGRGSPRAQ